MFGIFYSSLVLLLSGPFEFEKFEAISITSLFLGLHFSLPIIGGVVAKKIKFGMLLVTGKIFQLLGIVMILMSSANIDLVFLGMAFFLLDSSVSTVSLNMLIGNKYKQEELEGRGKAFLGAHVWTNIGFSLAFTVSGICFASASPLSLLYVASSVSMLCFLVSVFLFSSGIKFHEKNIAFLLGALLSVTAVFHLLKNTNASRWGVISSAMLGAALLILMSFRSSSRQEKVKQIKFTLFAFLSVVFWSIYMLGPTLVPLLLQKNVNKYVMGFDLPTQWIQLASPLFVVTLGGWLSKKRNFFVLGTNFFIGITCAVLSLFFILFAYSNNNVELYIILVGILLLSAGETFLAPTSMALPGTLIRAKWQPAYMAIIQLSLGVGVVLSSEIYKYITILNI